MHPSTMHYLNSVIDSSGAVVYCIADFKGIVPFFTFQGSLAIEQQESINQKHEPKAVPTPTAH